jgi:hypothetical protein
MNKYQMIIAVKDRDYDDCWIDAIEHVVVEAQSNEEAVKILSAYTKLAYPKTSESYITIHPVEDPTLINREILLKRLLGE